jgi:hypothetical protein
VAQVWPICVPTRGYFPCRLPVAIFHADYQAYVPSVPAIRQSFLQILRKEFAMQGQLL